MRDSIKLFTLCGFSFLGLLASCKDFSDFGDQFIPSLEPRYLNIKQKSIEFESASMLEKTIDVESAATPWCFNGYDESWLSFTPNTGESNTAVSVLATENTSFTSIRTSIALFKSTADDFEYSKQVTITQKATEAYLKTDSISLHFSAGRNQRSIGVATNVVWKADCSYVTSGGVESWLSVESSDDKKTVFIDAQENLSGLSRSARIILSSETEGVHLSAIIEVAQAAAEPSVNEDTLRVGTKGGAFQLSINSEVTWTAETNESWIQLTPVEGSSGITPMIVQVTENASTDARLGHILIYVGETPAVGIAVAQEGRYFSIDFGSPTDIGSRGGTHSIHVSTNEQWTSMSTSNWIQVSQKSGQGNIDVVLTIPDNPSLKDRADTTTFVPEHLQPVSIITRQAGRYLRTNVSSIHFFAKGGLSDVVSVTTDADYSISVSDSSWLTIHLTGNTFTVEALKNTGDEERNGVIKLTMFGLNEGESFVLEIPVDQKEFKAGINIDEFDEEQEWDIIVGNNLTITVTGFTNEICWD